MATVLAYVIADLQSSGRNGILAEFRANEDMALLLRRGMTERTSPPFAARPCTPGLESQDPASPC
jgi:hypothetical protein